MCPFKRGDYATLSTIRFNLWHVILGSVREFAILMPNFLFSGGVAIAFVYDRGYEIIFIQ